MVHTQQMANFWLKLIHKMIKFCELSGGNLNLALCWLLYVYACLCVHSDTSMTRQLHEKLLAPTTDKTTSGTRMAELMGREIGLQKKEEEGEETA